MVTEEERKRTEEARKFVGKPGEALKRQKKQQKKASEGQRFFIGDEQFTREEFEIAKRALGFRGGGGFRPDQAAPLLDRAGLPRSRIEQQVSQDPSRFGLSPQGQAVEQPEGIEVVTEEGAGAAPQAPEGGVLAQDIVFTDDAGVETTIPAGTPLAGLPPGLTGGLTPASPEEQVVTGAAIAGTAAAATPLATAWKVGKNIFSNPTKAVQAGNSAKTAKSAKSPLSVLKGWGALVGGFIGFQASKLLDKTGETQQALNTLGQITSTVVGDSTTSAGDWRKGLQELKFIKQEILRLESEIKTGSISSAVIKFDGRILDINADVFDQLATVDEGIRDIQSFALEGNFPDLSPQEIQEQLRILEEGGFLEPVDLTEARR